jgi:hypothetical protein
MSLTIAKKQFWLSTAGSGDGFTNGAGQQGFLLVGDSTTGYATDDTYGPTPTAGTVYEFNGTDIVEVGATDLLNTGFGGTGRGSMWPKFGIDYYAGSGKKPVFCDTHGFDSNLLWATDATNKWLYDATSLLKGDLYDAMKIKADACLAEMSLTKFKGIFILLGVNDIGDNLFSATQLNNAYNKLIEYLQTDFPGSPIYIVAPSVIDAGTTTQTALAADVRWHQITTVPTLYSDVKCMYYAQYAVACNLQTGAHWSSVMNNYMGASFAAYLQDTETDDYIRRVTNHFAIPLTAAHKLAWKTALTDLRTEGFLQVCNYLKLDVCTESINERFNITGITQPTYVEGNAYTFTANSSIRTGNGGANSFQSIMFVPSLHTKYGDANDQIFHNYVKQNYTASNVAETMFASGTAGHRIHGIGTADNYFWNASDGTNTQNGRVTRFPNDTWHGVQRPDSATKNFIRNSTVDHTAAVGGAVLNTGRMTRGGGLAGSLANMEHYACFAAKATGYTLANVITALNTLVTALKTP